MIGARRTIVPALLIVFLGTGACQSDREARQPVACTGASQPGGLVVRHVTVTKVPGGGLRLSEVLRGNPSARARLTRQPAPSGQPTAVTVRAGSDIELQAGQPLRVTQVCPDSVEVLATPTAAGETVTGPSVHIRRGVPWRFTGPSGEVTAGIAEMDTHTGTAELIVFGSGPTQRPRIQAGDEVTVAGSLFRVNDVVAGDRGTVLLTPVRRSS